MQGLLDFDVAIEPLADGYRARVVASPAGEAHADFALPFTDTDVENFVLKVGMSIGRVRRQARRIQSDERRLLEEFGDRLFQAAFCGPVRDCLRLSRAVAESRGAGLRIRLRLPGAWPTSRGSTCTTRVRIHRPVSRNRAGALRGDAQPRSRRSRSALRCGSWR